MKPYYESGGITIYHGDCREWLNAVDAGLCDPGQRTITDPPYGLMFASKSAKQRDGSVKTTRGGYGIDDTKEYVELVVVPIVSRLIRLHWSVVVTPGTACLWSYPPADDIGCWFSAAGTGFAKWGFRCSQPILFYGKDPYIKSGARPNSVGQVWPNDANTSGHPCAKPIRFMSWLVNRASLVDDLIVDPFSGSGTTLRAAKDLGRRAIGIEIEERYCEIAARRLDQEVLAL